MPLSVPDHSSWRLSADGLGWASQESGDSIGTCGQWLWLVDSSALFQYECLDLQNRARETGLALVPSCFLGSKIRDKATPRKRHRARSPRHNLGTFHNFGASAPGPNPQKTGTAHSSATSGE